MNRVELAILKKRRTLIKIAEDIPAVIDYGPCFPGPRRRYGIGYLGKKLVRFKSDENSIIALDIAVPDALEWMAVMVANGDYNGCTWDDDAVARFYRDIKAALKRSAK